MSPFQLSRALKGVEMQYQVKSLDQRGEHEDLSAQKTEAFLPLDVDEFDIFSPRRSPSFEPQVEVYEEVVRSDDVDDELSTICHIDDVPDIADVGSDEILPDLEDGDLDAVLNRLESDDIDEGFRHL